MTVASSVRLPPLPAPGPVHEPKKSSPVAGIVVGVLAGVLVGLTIGKFDLVDLPKVTLAPWQKLLLAALVVVTFPLVTLIHELGHLAGGALAGFRFTMLIWGPLKLMREGERIVLTRNRSMALAGGMALAVPTDTSSGNGRAALLVAGGPLTSLALGAALLLVSRTMPLPPDGSATFAQVLLAVLVPGLGLTSLGIGLVTLVPMRTSGFLTDGARLLRLARGGPTAARDRVLMTLVGLSMSPVRPREWPEHLVPSLDEPLDGTPFDAVCPLFTYYHALDTGRLELARAALAEVVARLGAVPPAARGSYALEFAFFELAVRHDAARARAWLDVPTAAGFDDRLLRPLLLARIGGTPPDAASDTAAELSRRSGVDRMRLELLGQV